MLIARHRGFTLIELMVGLALLAVLTMLAFPTFTTMVQNARLRAVADSILAGLQGARAEAATIGAQFEHLAIIADPAMLKGRRYGNMIIAGSDVPIAQSPALARELLGGGVPAHVWGDAEVRKFAASASVRED